jgi:hypothetical protein
VGGIAAVNTHRAQDQARSAAQPAPASQKGPSAGATGDGAETQQQRPIPFQRSGRRWGVRVHWGIVFAIVASLILWFAIKTVAGLFL